MDRVLVLTAARGVDDGTVGLATAAAAAAGRHGAPRRLGPGGVEMTCDAPGASAARAALAGRRVDANALPLEGREKRLLIADMDSTIIEVECIDELADFAGVKDRVAAITERAMRGEIDFDGALRERVALLKGLPLEALARCHAERVRLTAGARLLARTMAERGAETALVSGGFTVFAEAVARDAGFARVQANRLLDDGAALTGEVAEPILGRAAKLAALRRIAAEAGLGAAQTLALGDGANDLDMVAAAGLGVAFRAKPALEAGADASLRWSDLRAVLHLQGIPDAEHVSD